MKMPRQCSFCLMDTGVQLHQISDQTAIRIGEGVPKGILKAYYDLLIWYMSVSICTVSD